MTVDRVVIDQPVLVRAEQRINKEGVYEAHAVVGPGYSAQTSDVLVMTPWEESLWIMARIKDMKDRGFERGRLSFKHLDDGTKLLLIEGWKDANIQDEDMAAPRFAA